MKFKILVTSDDSSLRYAGYHSQTVSKLGYAHYKSSQQAKFWVFLMVFHGYPGQAFNIYSNSSYVVHTVKLINTAIIGHTNSKQLFYLYVQLQKLVRSQIQHCSIAQ